MRFTTATMTALGAATGLFIATASFAGEQNSSLPQSAGQTSVVADENHPAVTVTDAAPEAEPIVNDDGEAVTLKDLKNEAEWREETAQMLQEDTTSEPTR
jgi:hypothetical protein